MYETHMSCCDPRTTGPTKTHPASTFFSFLESNEGSTHVFEVVAHPHSDKSDLPTANIDSSSTSFLHLHWSPADRDETDVALAPLVEELLKQTSPAGGVLQKCFGKFWVSKTVFPGEF